MSVNALDGDYFLLRSHKAPKQEVTEKPKEQNGAQSPPLPTPPQSPTEPVAPSTPTIKLEDSNSHAPPPQAPAAPSPAPPKDAKLLQPMSAAPQPQTITPAPRPSLGVRASSDNQGSKGAVGNLKKEKDGRRGSWISSLSSKFGGGSETKRNTSVDSPISQKIASSPRPSPKVEFGNPFDSKMGQKDPKLQEKKDENKKTVITSAYTPPRRQSVLVAAGKETKLEQPGFLSSALRRLSSSGNANMGKAASTGAICARKVMNIDQNRERIKIHEFDQNKLKRVAFCVDVEIAGYAAQADEEPQQNARPPMSGAGQRASLSGPSTKDSKDSKYKEKGEGHALKNPEAASAEKDSQGHTNVDAAEAKAQAKQEAKKSEESEAKSEEEDKTDGGKSEPQPVPTTRKKEKKKRSEAERKERRERKRRHAEQNGLVPLELTRDDDSDSDSTPGSTPPGASTPRKSSDSPTTDPLRIYKRCCQLRETTVLSKVKEQISKPAATLAEAPGTVAFIDLSGTEMQLQDIVTFGDWLAVVPVRKLVLNECNLSDEGVRVILSGLSSCKSAEQAKANRKLPRRLSGKSGREQMGVIEKLSLKNNSAITSIGWKHIALFLHMSRSLKAIDLSGIPFPKSSSELSRTTTASSGHSTGANTSLSKTTDIGVLITKAIAERLGDKLEELIMSGCGLSTQNVSDIVDAAVKCKIRRLGIAGNALDQDALGHVVRYIKSGACEGLDLGGINLHGTAHMIADALDEKNPLFAISFADCKLAPDDLTQIMKPMAALKNLKFVDLSQNPDLFKGAKNSVPVFRKFLPRLKELKRIHLADDGLTSDHVIAIAEILPDCPALCHLNILENEPLVQAMNAKDGASQEEACAYFASLMTAVRVSQTIIAIEIEVPSNDSSEVVRALASQVVAYSLRNMERGVEEFGVSSHSMPDKDAPEVLLHIVGHMEGYSENHDNDEPAPDEDYVIASTGIVKALGVCLGTKDVSRTHTPRNASPTHSGPGTPKQGPLRPKTHKKPRDVSLELCESARKIRMRLRPALVKEDKAGNDMDYRRLLFLDQTLQRMIQRFEDEYPETKIPPLPPSEDINGNAKDTLGSSLANASVLSAATDENSLSQIPSGEDYIEADQENRDPHLLKLSRTSSNTSLAAKAITNEEGRMHRFGQGLRREVLRPSGMTDHLHGTNADDVEPEHLAKLRAKLEEFQGEEIRQRVLRDGGQSVIDEVGISAKELALLQKEDPEGFAKFADAQLKAQLNMEISKDDAVAPDAKKAATATATAAATAVVGEGVVNGQ